MNEAAQRQYQNAVEVWQPFDTVCIGEGQSSVQNSRWYETFAALAADDQIPLFNVRNRASVGVAYTNMDTAGQLPYGFRAYSIGISLMTPALDPVVSYSGDGEGLDPLVMDFNTKANAIFAGELVKHCSIRMQVSQDEKLVNTVQGTPSGEGINGVYNLDSPDLLQGTELGTVTAYSNGVPDIRNRFKFPIPIDIPRNHIFNVSLKFSTYAREILQRLAGPGRVMINTQPAVVFDLEDATVPAIFTIRASLFGVRYVQQRNEQHFAG